MKAAGLSQIKKELSNLSEKELIDTINRLGRHKKENKELLSYLLFDSSDEQNFIKDLKIEIDILFDGINRGSMYWTRKGLRKIVRYIDKYCRFSDHKSTEVELRIYFCKKMITEKIPMTRSTMLNNIFLRQLDKIKNAISKLHPDERLDFQFDMEDLMND